MAMKRKEKKPTKKVDQILLALQILIRDDFKFEETLSNFSERLERVEKLMAVIIEWHKDLKVFEEKIFKDNMKKFLES